MGSVHCYKPIQIAESIVAIAVHTYIYIILIKWFIIMACKPEWPANCWFTTSSGMLHIYSTYVSNTISLVWGLLRLIPYLVCEKAIWLFILDCAIFPLASGLWKYSRTLWIVPFSSVIKLTHSLSSDYEWIPIRAHAAVPAQHLPCELWNTNCKIWANTNDL